MATPSQRGQALPMALGACLMVLALCLFSIKAGRLVLDRVRNRHRADITAFSAGVDYARAMNLLAYSEKALGVSYASTVILPMAGGRAVKMVRGLQDSVLKAGPWMVEASMAHLGWENGLMVVPVWNGSGLKPGFNVVTKGPVEYIAEGIETLKEAAAKLGLEFATAKAAEIADEAITQAARSGRGREVLEELGYVRPEYSRQPRGGGPRVEVPEDQIEVEVHVGKDGRREVRYKDKKTHKYMKRTDKADSSLPLDVDDLGGHSILILAASLKQEPGKRMWSASKIQVAGGNLDIFGSDSAEYGPFFVPVRSGEDFNQAWSWLKSMIPAGLPQVLH